MENTQVEVRLKPGLYLVSVDESGRVQWVEMPDTPEVQRLSLAEAADHMLVPALAMLRSMRG